MNKQIPLLNYLLDHVTENKKNLFDVIIQNRTRYITVVLEDIYHPHNASAVLRTCDCFGIQDVHIIENKKKYRVNPDVAQGSAKWLNIIRHRKARNNTLEAISIMKEKGYRIVATTPKKHGITPDKLTLENKIAFWFGTELEGLSDNLLDNADEFLRIPMYGFTESFNVSVSAAIILHDITKKLHTSSVKWQLSEKEKIGIKLQWVRNVVKSSELLEKKFLKNF